MPADETQRLHRHIGELVDKLAREKARADDAEEACALHRENYLAVAKLRDTLDASYREAREVVKLREKDVARLEQRIAAASDLVAALEHLIEQCDDVAMTANARAALKRYRGAP